MDNEHECESTEDIQHDLAMLLADSVHDDLAQQFTNELIRRGATVPTNCKWEHNIFCRGKRKLSYEVGT